MHLRTASVSQVARPTNGGRAWLPRAVPRIEYLVLPTAAAFVAFFVAPLLLIAFSSVLPGYPAADGMTSANFERLVEDSFYAEVLWTTVKLATITTIATLAVGYPLAFFLARLEHPTLRTVFLLCTIAPMLVGIVVRTFAWMTILSREGLINSALISLGVRSEPLDLMYNESSIVLALVHIYLPFMVLTLIGVLARIDRRLEEAAATLGASRLVVFLEVTLPLSLPGIFAGSLLVFILAFSAYVTPSLLGGFTIQTIPMLIYQHVGTSFDLGFASTLGVLVLATTLTLILLYNRAVRSFSRQTIR